MSNSLNGNWPHRSFRNVDIPAGTDLAVPWASEGALAVTTNSNGSVNGQLTFPTGIVLFVSGQIQGSVAAGVAARWPMPASVDLHAAVPEPGMAEYRLRGWFIPNTNSVVGTVMAVKDDLADALDGTLGPWVLVKG